MRAAAGLHRRYFRSLSLGETCLSPVKPSVVHSSVGRPLPAVPMPFIHSVSGLTGKESSTSSLAYMANKGREDRGSSVKERITLNLKHLGKKGEDKGSGGGGGANGGAAGRRRPDKANNRAPKNTDAITAARAAVQAQGGVKAAGAKLRSKLKDPEEVHFTLTLTPEAVLLLQKRSSERNQRAGCGGAADAKVNGRRRDAPSKRPQPGAQRRSSEAQVDIRSILKVSLLNDRHKYDDVEYEEEEEYALDQRVVLKCTEWLRGLESPVTAVGEAVGCKSSGKSC